MTRPRIQQRTRIYLGCEGESEQSYGKRLNEIADSFDLHLHFDNDLLRPGGGDPLALVQLAIRRIKEKEVKRGMFALRAILLDKDKLGLSPERDAQIESLTQPHRLLLIWQDTCHESFLLRHLEGQDNARPQTTGLAFQALKRAWPEYHKPMSAMQLAVKIDLCTILRARSVESAFAEFLDLIGLTQGRTFSA
jgi:hypothetical protein